ncbi:MAG TPA: FAD-dependent oxidoreductase [Candidatus Saccharimonadales bacterium]|nr:FAD-dependent oxidoreductase [Candidatus Saccharimonadales bacterium]
MQHIVIVGGGFGGIKAARELAKHPELFKVTLISDEDCFRYYPALYRTASGHSKRESCIAIELLIHDLKNVTFLQGKASKIDRATKRITLEDGSTVQYDKAIFALGVITSYFGIPGMKEYSHGLKTMEELDQLHKDLHEEFVDDRMPDKNYVIVGAGPTGVELAASLRSYLRQIAKWHHARSNKITLELIEAAPRILPRSHQKGSELAAKRLHKLGIKMMPGKKVEAETADSLMVSGRSIPTRTVIWTAGVTNNPFYESNKTQFSLNERGRVTVNRFMQVDDSLFVIGDNADTPHAGLALTAVRDARYVVQQIVRTTKGKSLQAYHQKTPITVIPIGHKWALVEYGPLVFGGWPGGLLRWLADLVAYKDIMPLGQAFSLWRNDKAYEDDGCEICAQAQFKH